MITFLAGSITENIWNNEGIITNQFGFKRELKQNWRENARVLYIVSDPFAYEENDRTLVYYRDCFARSTFSFACFDLLDRRYQHDFNFEKLASYDVIILGGGRVPQQYDLIRELALREFFQQGHFQGIVIGISAGALNCAEETYNWPEEQGDTISPDNPRFYQGLGLVKSQVLPHYQARYDMYVDGRHLYNDITVADSLGHKFIALPDYSYVIAKEGNESIHGPYSFYCNGSFFNLFGQERITA